MTGIIDVGGGLRGVYGSGVLDRCMDENLTFDIAVGVSAGSANIATFAAGQRGRTLRFYRDYTFRPEYMSLGNVLKGRRYLDLDYIYGGLSNEGMEDPFGFDSFAQYPGKVILVATNAETGEPVYFGNESIKKNDLSVLKCSSCLPVVCGSFSVNGTRCFDGGISDPIPLKKLFEEGCDRAIVILTMPRDEQKVQGIDGTAAKLLARRFPEAAKKIEKRYELYNEQLEYLKHAEADGRALIIAPDNTCGMKTLTKDKEKTLALYQKGYDDAAVIADFIMQKK